MINLYLIRHGIAADRTQYTHDEERPLTKEGINKTRRIAKRLGELGLNFDLILTSPLIRAYQTAEILQESGLSHQVEVSPHLAPDGTLSDWLNWLKTWSGGTELAIVGHEPNLSEWAETLIGGQTLHSLILKKAGMIGLNLPEGDSPIGKSQLFWLTAPKYLLN